MPFWHEASATATCTKPNSGCPRQFCVKACPLNATVAARKDDAVQRARRRQSRRVRGSPAVMLFRMAPGSIPLLRYNGAPAHVPGDKRIRSLPTMVSAPSSLLSSPITWHPRRRSSPPRGPPPSTRPRCACAACPPSGPPSSPSCGACALRARTSGRTGKSGRSRSPRCGRKRTACNLPPRGKPSRGWADPTFPAPAASEAEERRWRARPNPWLLVAAYQLPEVLRHGVPRRKVRQARHPAAAEPRTKRSSNR
mmetsp:Transcript_38828/g.78341  ORF Transcript_38828/g.78341 Transcript_38828/m.78341 type:complete len:253 (+) Transcript_38828:150-908(+)